MSRQVFNQKTQVWDVIDEVAPSFEPVLTAEAVLAQARAAAIEEIIADTERKRLGAVRDVVAAKFKDAKSEKDISDKLTELKTATGAKGR